MAKNDKDDRVFVRDGRRHFRRRYSLTEPRIGLGILVLLAAIIGWVAWRGAHPDPALFAAPVATLELGVAPGATDRGPLPGDLALEGWTEGKVSAFDPSNLYVKINGREDYYKSFGFQMLYFVSIVNNDDPSTVVDIEMFDLGEGRNALGAYAGERSPEAISEPDTEGMTHFDRNVLFMTRGPLYIRAIGSDETPLVRAQLERLRTRFAAELEGEALPWAYALFVGALGMDPGKVSYAAENAFSFGFANDVYSVLLDDGETELFVVRTAGPDAAASLAAQFTTGFLDYGTSVEGDGVRWVEDQYIKTLAGATPQDSWVGGVRGAPTLAAAESALSRLLEALRPLTVEDAPREQVEPNER